MVEKSAELADGAKRREMGRGPASKAAKEYLCPHCGVTERTSDAWCPHCGVTAPDGGEEAVAL